MASQQVILQLAAPTNARAIAEMSRDVIETGLGWSWTRDRVEHEIRRRDTLVLCARHDEKIVGFAIMNFGDETAHLALFAVRPPFQRSGIGRQMFEWLRESAVTAGIAIIQLELRAGNMAARRFYRSLGFDEVGLLHGYYQQRESALRMVLDLRQSAMRSGG